MRAFGLLMFLAAIFIIINSNTIREVLQGKTKINFVNLGSSKTTDSKTTDAAGGRSVGGSF